MAQQEKRKMITEITPESEEHKFINEKPFHYAFLREITDQYEEGEISYGKMVEMLNEVAIKWHNQQLEAEVDKVHEYYKRRR